MINPLHKLVQQKAEQRRADTYRALLNHGSKIGGQLFGAVPPGHRREFFCLDEHTWIWHEEWKDEQGKHHVATTRYSVRPDGILKSQGGQSYQRLSPAELRNLYRAAKLYRTRFGAELQRIAAA